MNADAALGGCAPLILLIDPERATEGDILDASGVGLVAAEGLVEDEAPGETAERGSVFGAGLLPVVALERAAEAETARGCAFSPTEAGRTGGPIVPGSTGLPPDAIRSRGKNLPSVAETTRCGGFCEVLLLRMTEALEGDEKFSSIGGLRLDALSERCC
jgi:hypothetical protein